MKFFSIILFLSISTTVFSQQLVEFRGVGRSGIYNETGLLKEWPETGPELFLKIEGVGKGFSQPVFNGYEIFISGIKEDTIDILSAYNLKGEMLWETPYGRSWTNTYVDSRSTPTYENGKLFVISGTGRLNCINSKSGEIVWQVNVSKTYEGVIFKHGDAESPLIVGNSVLYTTGGEQNTLIALDKNDGTLLWKTKSLGGAKSYASPVLIRHNEKNFIIVQTSENIISVEPGTGEIMWSY
ncbi:MAG: PQQ-binding-like beta-propeller repeat protein, partial [Draconibacterium sp.]|nr:PQQ-binding-like beta-propeller repeat protein [Draconibacterium sp.]